MKRQYGLEFKTQGLHTCEQGDVPIAQGAREHGINVKLLYRWRSEEEGMPWKM